MSNLKTAALLPFLLASYLPSPSMASDHASEDSASAPGIFEGNGDVGKVLHAGSADYNPKTKVYTVTGSGEDIWLANDAFHFVWKKISGDVTLTSDVSLLGTVGNNHRKAVLMIRQSLDADAAYADAALHGDGLTSLQFRDRQGESTHEVQANVSGPARLRLMKRGNRFYMWTAAAGAPLQFAGGSALVSWTGTYYVGIGVCAHDKDAVQKATFSKVEIKSGKQPPTRPAQYSTLETVAVASTDARANYVSTDVIESPNWSPDGKTLLFNTHKGRMERVPVTGGKAEVIRTGLKHCYSNHGISPDGQLLAVSALPPNHKGSAIYVMPLSGGQPRVLVSQSPSEFYGWSPDGSTIAFHLTGNLYTVPADGGPAKKLPEMAKSNDLGPDFSPDGKFIYFSSDRGGSTQVWRMQSDGSEPQQLTNDKAWNNTYPHVSPNGEQLVFLSYPIANKSYPMYEDVQLRVMSLADQNVKVLAKLTGGMGTIDSPSWSPDSKRVAFVSYQFIQ